MAKYEYVEKDSFSVLGIGVELKSDYMDQDGIRREKREFFDRVSRDGTIDHLKSIAKNDMLFIVNEAVDNKMMHYVGVVTDQELPEATRVIQFPEGKYIAVPGEGASQFELADKLTEVTFGDVLYQESEYAYVGGPNTAVIMGEKDGTVVGEMWVPVVKQ